MNDKELEEVRKIIGKKIEKKCQDKGITSTQLANLIGASQADISSYKNGHIFPTAARFKKIVEVLDCCMTCFFQGELVTEFDVFTKMKLDEVDSCAKREPNFTMELAPVNFFSSLTDVRLGVVSKSNGKPLVLERGEQFIYVLKGEIKIDVIGQSEKTGKKIKTQFSKILKENDGVYFEKNFLTLYKNFLASNKSASTANPQIRSANGDEAIFLIVTYKVPVAMRNGIPEALKMGYQGALARMLMAYELSKAQAGSAILEIFKKHETLEHLKPILKFAAHLRINPARILEMDIERDPHHLIIHRASNVNEIKPQKRRRHLKEQSFFAHKPLFEFLVSTSMSVDLADIELRDAEDPPDLEKHPEEEIFIVLSGAIELKFRDENGAYSFKRIEAGQGCRILSNTEHVPVAVKKNTKVLWIFIPDRISRGIFG